MKNFHLDLREHTTKIINYEKKEEEMISLIKEEKRSLLLYWKIQRSCSQHM